MMSIFIGFILLGSLAVTSCSVVETTEGAGSEGIKLVGGNEAKPHSHPWIVSIQQVIGSDRRHVCGGTIISATQVATSGSCCANYSKPSLRVMAGAHDLKYWEASVQVKYVEKVTLHPKYDPTSNRFDACKITLSSPLDLNNEVKALPLCDSEPWTPLCTTAGWGYSGAIQKTALQEAKFPTYSRTYCVSEYFEIAPIEVDMICAGGYSQGACFNDQGSPLECQFRESSNDPCLAGIASWWHGPCGNGQLPTVFTNVDYNEIKAFLLLGQ